MNRRLIILVTFASVYAHAQAQPPRFEAVSIKRNLDPPAERGPRSSVTAGGMTLRRVSLASLIATAWNVQDQSLRLADSKLTGSDFFDVDARAAAPATKEQMNLMLRTMLADRFGLVLHTEPREYSVLSLVIGKNGSKLTAVQPGPSPQVIFRPLPDRQFRLTGQKAPVFMLAGWLQSIANNGTAIVDNTGLTGTYDFVLEFLPEQPPGAAEPATGPSMFGAVQDQLGLKLEPHKVMLDTLVIDKVSKSPTDN